MGNLSDNNDNGFDEDDLSVKEENVNEKKKEEPNLQNECDVFSDNIDVVQLEKRVLIKLTGKEKEKRGFLDDQRNEDRMNAFNERQDQVKSYMKEGRRRLRYAYTVVDDLNGKLKKKKEQAGKEEQEGETAEDEKSEEEIQHAIKRWEEGIEHVRKKIQDAKERKRQDKKEYYKKTKEDFDPNYRSTKDIKINTFFKDLPIEAHEFESLEPRYYSHGFIDILHKAFTVHLPIEISPDNIWLLILQAISQHQEQTNELAKIFPFPETKQEIKIQADDFVKGSETNDWVRIFDQFEKGIKERIPESLYNLLSNKSFSTTTKLDRICYTVTLMKSLQNFFDYSMHTCCGIFEIYVTGTIDDWENLSANTNEIMKSGIQGLEDWFPIILDIIDHFIRLFRFTNQNDDDEEEVQKLTKKEEMFWRSIYKWEERSGGPEISGWICAFFPYEINRDTGNLERAYWRTELTKVIEERGEKRWKDWKDLFTEGERGYWNEAMTPSHVPSGVSSVPFEWKYNDDVMMKYYFYAGFLGCEQKRDGTFTLKPKVGYAVGQRIEKEEKMSQEEHEVEEEKEESNTTSSESD